MVINLKTKTEFLKDFQQKIIQGRKLLHLANHLWADRLLTDLYFEYNTEAPIQPIFSLPDAA
ncbi:unnamed protein product, partial [marine sediment metagenome]